MPTKEGKEMAEKRKSTKTRKSSAGKSKAESGVEVLLEEITDKLGELAGDAEAALKEAGSTTRKTAGRALEGTKKTAGRALEGTKKTAGRALEGTKKKAGEAVAQLPILG